MIKRLIFDLDGTLIPFPKELLNVYTSFIKKYNLNLTPMDLYKLIGSYENYYDIYDYNLLLNVINNKLNTKLDRKFLDEFMYIYDRIDKPLENEKIETLKYLRDKYSLVVLTNWFTDSQKNRMKNLEILNYFDDVYGGDLVKVKPNKESFLMAMGSFKPSECVSIGDRYKIDIKPAEEIGIKTYILSNKRNYSSIEKISDLKEML